MTSGISFLLPADFQIHGLFAPFFQAFCSICSIFMFTHIRANQAAQGLWEEEYSPPDGTGAASRLAWSATVLDFPKPREGRSDADTIDPQRVQQAIQATQNRTEAAEFLQKELGWSTTPN